MLGFYSVESGMEIHVIDTDPFSLSRNGGLTNTALVEKYKMTDDDYSKRKGSVRQFIQDKRKQDPNWKPGKAKQTTMGVAPAEELPTGPETVQGIEVGARCQVMPGERRGTVKFVGEVEKLKEGYWVGVLLDEPLGSNDGTVKGTRIFECPGDCFGAFVRGRNCTVGDFPEKDLMDEENSDAEL
jgi:tubulin-folding cofactor B